MPDRVVRDDMLDSERYLGLSSDTARMLFVHFILVADDLGNSEASDLFIRRRLLTHATTNAAISTLLSELSDVDLVRVYEVDGKRYVHIPRFRQRLRYTKSAHPRPPENLECLEIRELLLKRPDLCPTADSPKTDSSRKKRSEEKRSNPLAQAFARFWEHYPKRVSKGQAEKAFRSLQPSEQLLASILAGLERAKTSDQWQRENGRFIPHPATWIRAKGWEDETPGELAGGDYTAGAI